MYAVWLVLALGLTLAFCAFIWFLPDVGEWCVQAVREWRREIRDRAWGRRLEEILMEMEAQEHVSGLSNDRLGSVNPSQPHPPPGPK